MPTLSPSENYYRMLQGEVPEYIPKAGDMGFTGISALMPFPRDPSEPMKDLFGVPMSMEPNSGPIPTPGVFILDDVRKWRDVIKRPAVLDEIDWEITSKKDMEARDPAVKVMGMGSIGNGYFQSLMAWMGFSNGLVACLEEPEEVKALLTFLLDMNMELSKNFIHYYKPDAFMFFDDIAHERSPFVSEATFLEIFEPMWRLQTALYKEAGLPAEHHNCGKIEPFVDYIVQMGFNAMDPSQPTYNDLAGIKARYNNKFGIVGGLENNGFVSWPETTEEEIRAEVRRVVNELAPGGGFAFIGSVLGPMGGEFNKARNDMMADEFEKIRYDFYK